MSHTGIAYCIERNVQGMLPHHSFSVECACVEYYPWLYCIQ